MIPKILLPIFLLLNTMAVFGAPLHKARSVAESYTPMLEVGKEWKYTLWHNAVYRPKVDDRQFSLKVEKCDEIDGRKYYYIGYYMDGEKVDGGFGYGSETYLWEDVEARRVYAAYFTEDGGVRNQLFYDFGNPADREASMCVDDAEVRETDYVRFDGTTVHAFQCGDGGRYMLVEGIGFVSSPDYETDPATHCFGNLLTGPTLGPSGDAVLDKIYEVVDGDGNIIYSLPNAYPGALSGVDAATAENVGFTVTGDCIRIDSTAPIGMVTVYSPVGIVVKREVVRATEHVVDTGRLSPGVYIVRVGSKVFKFTI